MIPVAVLGAVGRPTGILPVDEGRRLVASPVADEAIPFDDELPTAARLQEALPPQVPVEQAMGSQTHIEDETTAPRHRWRRCSRWPASG